MLSSGASWFCLRTQPKHEHIAAAHLKREPDVEVYLPRIRFKRSTRRGPVWFTEALFPNYLFARFDFATSLRKLSQVRGVSGVVHFGNQWPTIPDDVIGELRAAVGSDEVHVIQNELQPGEPVEISGGAFHGLQAVVTRVMPSRERVAVLLEFLGQQTMIEVPTRCRRARRGWTEAGALKKYSVFSVQYSPLPLALPLPRSELTTYH